MKKYHLIVFGCQMNISDSERLANILEKNKYQSTNEIKKADLVCLIACSVRQMAINRIYGAIKNIKKENPKTKIIVTGCLTKKDKKLIQEKVNLVFSINKISNLANLLKIKGKKLVTGDYLKIKPKYSTFPLAYIPIMTGCNNFCTYCVVPYTRQKEISRPSHEIIKETKDLIKKGYKIIVLLGQNVNSYKSNISFPELLNKISKLPGNFWLTFITSHPKDLSTTLINIMAQKNKVIPYLHLPVQSGDNKILRKMNRHYTINHYKKIIEQARKKIKNLNISTDIIVGFPNETKKEFNNTAKLMRWVKYDMAYVAKYSPRPGTVAEKLNDNVSAQEKNKRWRALTKILEKTALKKNKKYIGKKIDVLIENKKNNHLFGQTRNFKNVKIIYDSIKSTRQPIKIPRIGETIKIKITKAISWGLEGFITK